MKLKLRHNLFVTGILLFGALAMAIEVGDMIEIETYLLNARKGPNFLRTTHNVLYTLEKGTRGEVQETKKFSSGNTGLKIVVQDGPHKGESVWVLHRPDVPLVKLVDENDRETRNPDDAEELELLQRQHAVKDPDDRRPAQSDAARGSGKTDVTNDPEVLRAIQQVTDQQEAFARLGAGKPDQGCDPGTRNPAVQSQEQLVAADPNTLTPQKALQLALSDQLKFVGKTRLGNNPFESCLWKNSNVFVLYDFCAKDQLPAASAWIFNPDGQGLHLLAARPDTDSRDISEQTEGELYSPDTAWGIEYRSADPNPMQPDQFLQMGVKDLLKYESVQANHADCTVSNLNQASGCLPAAQNAARNWLPSAKAFWIKPSAEWNQFLKKMRTEMNQVASPLPEAPTPDASTPAVTSADDSSAPQTQAQPQAQGQPQESGGANQLIESAPASNP